MSFEALHGHLDKLVAEYATVVAKSGNTENPFHLQSCLIQDSDWTTRGAAAIEFLARHYGSFVLSNALALAVALGIEDGDCGL